MPLQFPSLHQKINIYKFQFLLILLSDEQTFDSCNIIKCRSQ